MTRCVGCWTKGLSILALAVAARVAIASDLWWDERFGAEGLRGGGSGLVAAITQFDDGRGPAVYVGGSFHQAGGVDAVGIARWDGVTWSAVGHGLDPRSFDRLAALAVFDDGRGPKLYAGGLMRKMGGEPVSAIACWDGVRWTSVAGGVGSFEPEDLGYVGALAVHDDGAGPALYVGGRFERAGNIAAANIARWNGTNWSSLGDGLNGTVSCLVEFDAGAGRELYAGGDFYDSVGGTWVHLAKWNGQAWRFVLGLNGTPFDLAVYDDGSGAALHAAGQFQTAAGLRHVLKWDGTAWTTLGADTYGNVHALAVFADAGGSALYAGGTIVSAGGVPTPGLARWDGTAWSAVLGAIEGVWSAVWTLEALDGPRGPVLYTGGEFARVEGRPAGAVATWDGAEWSYLDGGVTRPEVSTFLSVSDGELRGLYAGGPFLRIGAVETHFIARWDGGAWRPLAEGLDDRASALTLFDAGDGLRLYAAGAFTHAGGVPADRIARWDGSVWSALPGGGFEWRNDEVLALAVYDGGAGPELYAAGNLSRASGLVVDYIARWDGAQWSKVGSGTTGTVNALQVYDDGTGPALYVAGGFDRAGGQLAGGLARWDGSTWTRVAAGLEGSFTSLAVFDDGRGPALYAGGTADYGAGSGGIVRWDGQTLRIVEGTEGWLVRSLAVHDDGGGPALYAGLVQNVGAPGHAFLVRWDGQSWEMVGGDTDGTVTALASHDDGPGAALYAGGWFPRAGGRPAGRIARWGRYPHPGDLNCDGHVDFGDVNPFVLALANPAAWQAQFPGCQLLNGDINSDGLLDFGDINPFVQLLTGP